jgi:hydrogenase-4 component E
MIDFIIILFCISMLLISSSSRIESYIKVLSVQGLLLFFMSILDVKEISSFNTIILVLETLGVKTIIMPLFLINIVRKNEIYKESAPHINNFYSIVITTFIFALGFLIAYFSGSIADDIKPLHFGLSISTMLAAMFIIINKRKIITHILGYMIFENGIFLLSLALAKEMPIIVDMGILLDLFIGIFLLGLFVNKFEKREG